MEIIQYENEFKDEAIALILGIQNDEAKVNLTIEDQPDLLDITKAYLNNDGNFWLAIDSGQVVGTLALMKIDNEWSVLKKFFVRSDYRSRKVGLSLYDRLLEFARLKGYRHIILDTPSVAIRSHKFYERSGFRLVDKSELKVRYDYPDRQSLLYQLDI